MQDGIINGTGNSRYLKSISNFLAQYPTYQDFVAALVAGTLPIDLNGINETGWDQLGTALNKENLLSDETAEAFGDLLNPAVPGQPVPNDAILALLNYIRSDAIPKRKRISSETGDGSTIIRISMGSLPTRYRYYIQVDFPENADANVDIQFSAYFSASSPLPTTETAGVTTGETSIMFDRSIGVPAMNKIAVWISRDSINRPQVYLFFAGPADNAGTVGVAYSSQNVQNAGDFGVQLQGVPAGVVVSLYQEE